MGWLGYGTCLTQAKSEMTPLISALWARFHSIKPNFTKPKATRTRSLFSKRFDKTFGISKCFAQFCLDAVDLSAIYVRSGTKNHKRVTNAFRARWKFSSASRTQIHGVKTKLSEAFWDIKSLVFTFWKKWACACAFSFVPRPQMLRITQQG